MALRALQLLMWFVCLSHVALGLALMASPDLHQKIAELYGAKVNFTPQFTYILKALGVFMLVLGLIGLAAAMKPLKYSFIVYGFAGLLVLRVVQRIMLQADIQSAFDVDPSRNWVNAGFFGLLAILLVVLMQFAKDTSTPRGA